MRAKANQFKAVVVGFAVDQNKVRLDVAITAIVQRADQSMGDRQHWGVTVCPLREG